MAGMFGTIFSSAGDGIQSIEDNMDSATDNMVAQGEAVAAQPDTHMGNAIERGDAAADRMESRVDHVGNALHADVGVHAEFEMSIHAKSGGSYEDADGTSHEWGRSFDMGTGNIVIDQNLNLGETADHVFEGTTATMHSMSDSALDAM